MTPQQRFDIVLYRINNARELLPEIKDHIERGYYNTAMNRMYYACFYAVSALLLHTEIDGIKSHEGVRQMFGKHFILTHIIPKEWGHFYTIIYNNRTAADYEDFKNSHQNISVSYAMVYTKYQQLFNTRKARNSASI